MITMTAPDLLAETIETNHRSLREKLRLAAAAHPSLDRPRDAYPDIDTFLAAASRHNAAFHAVILPEARTHVPDGHQRARDFIRQSKVFEVALAELKARLYGSAQAMHHSWAEVFDDVRRHADATWRMERALVAELQYADLPEVRNELVGAFDRAERHAPTRPHPFIPHQGFVGQGARRIALLVDRFWDMAEGRMVPEPVRVHDRSHDGLLTQYLLADPHFPDEDETPS
jgi:hypothetical protein